MRNLLTAKEAKNISLENSFSDEAALTQINYEIKNVALKGQSEVRYTARLSSQIIKVLQDKGYTVKRIGNINTPNLYSFKISW